MALPGRPDKFTPQRRAKIVQAISKSIPYEYAAEANGICEATLYNWLDYARKCRTDGISNDYTDFLEAIKKAESKRIEKHIGNIDGGSETWTCDAWMLERRWWKHYSKSAPILDFEARLKKMEEDKAQGDSDAK